MTTTLRSTVGCCIACGRDTRGHGDFCWSCRFGERGMLDGNPLPRRPPPELEDDYGEESGPDSICRDGNN